jgi:TPR repeat protein
MNVVSLSNVGLAGNEPAIDSFVALALEAAEWGDADAYYRLGLAFSSGSRGVPCDSIEAHKWFNLAAAQGHTEAAELRADLASDMTAREIGEAQSRARLWLVVNQRQAA